MNALKSSEELGGMRFAHVMDRVTMAYFMAWLEDKIVLKGQKIVKSKWTQDYEGIDKINQDIWRIISLRLRVLEAMTL